MKHICKMQYQGFGFAFIVVLEIFMRGSFTLAHVLNDMNNMLRDANPTMSTFEDIQQYTTLRKPQTLRIIKEKVSAVRKDYAGNTERNDYDNQSGIKEEDSTAKLLVFVDNINVPNTTIMNSESAKGNVLEEQVRLLTKQLNALMNRRREDYELLERNLRKSLQITSSTGSDKNLRKELDQLRLEVKSLTDGHITGNKERVTVEWLQESVVEIRKQLVELQNIASNTAKDISHRAQTYEDLETIRHDFAQLKMEVGALRERQQQNEVLSSELREEMLQQEEEYRHFVHLIKNMAHSQNISAVLKNHDKAKELQFSKLANHNRRHCRFQREQIHELHLDQQYLKRQFKELKYHRIGERVRNVEIEQHRIADANFNLSRQIASLDKFHSSLLELLEDVEGLQNKMDKNLPELRHEISKLEFTNVQLLAEQSIAREEGKNLARSVQAISVSVSTLQDECETYKHMNGSIIQLVAQIDRLQSVVHNFQHDSKYNRKLRCANRENLSVSNEEIMVKKLSNVEEQYESIINKLPEDCSEIHRNNSISSKSDGLHLISLAGQHRPLLAHCTNDGWTTIQRRYDGSINFNRSWEDYAKGFGTPAGEYWIGNEQLHQLTVNNCTGLRVVMRDIYDNLWLAEYGNFFVSSRADGYRLHVGTYSGNASDALDYQQGMQFSAIDVDRDISTTHCAANYEGGWWFSHCQHANLNGRYNLGLTWFDTSRNEWVAIKSSHMLVKKYFHSKVCEDFSTTRDTVDHETAKIVSSEQVNGQMPENKLYIVNGDDNEIFLTTKATSF